MKPDQLTATGVQRNYGKIVFVLSLFALVTNLGLMAVFLNQTKQSEQTLLGQWKTFTYPLSENSQDSLSAFTLDAQGRAWVGGQGLGLSMLNPDGTWTIYTTINSEIPSDDIEALTSSPTGYIGVGARNGITMLSLDGLWEISTSATLPRESVNYYSPFTLAFDQQNHLWAGYEIENEIYQLSGDGSWEAYELPDSYNIEAKAILFDDQNRLWTGGAWTGLRRLDNHRTWTTLHIPAPDGDRRPISVSDLAIDQQGRVWVAGMWNGLFVINPDDTWKSITSDQSGTEIINVGFIAIDSRDDVWMVASSTFDESGGLDLIQMTKDGKWSFYTARNSGIPDDVIIGLEIDKQDRIWIGHYKGVTVLDTSTAPQQQAEVSAQLDSQSGKLLGTKIAAVGLFVILGVSILSANSILSCAGVLAFAGGFAGWFVLNTLFFLLQLVPTSYLPNICSGSGTAALGCYVLVMLITTFLTYIFNAGVLIYLARKKRWAVFWGFVTAFLANLMTLFILGMGFYFQFSDPLILLINLLKPFYL